jgi:phenylacetate-coenzyme A ligase PaaK-like adenylate-forming protein
LKNSFETLSQLTGEALSLPLPTGELLTALGKFAEGLHEGAEFRTKATSILKAADIPEHEIIEGLDGIKAFLQTKTLKAKLRRELGDEDPFALRRVDFQQAVFEGWAPLGLIVHVAPSNAWTVGFLSVVEGLLAGNVNFLKLSSNESEFAIEALTQLAKCEPTGALRARIHAARVPSSEKEQMKNLLSQADGVAAWGGEEAIRSLREMTPEGARFVDWGPKISFAYFTPAGVTPEALMGLVKEVCEGDQQACSAPQCVYLETDDKEALDAFSQALAITFESMASDIPARTPDMAEQSEITVVTRMQELKRALGEGDTIKGEGWRLLIDSKPGLRPSPLYRSLWVKAITRRELISTLRPLRRYLQTAGVSASPFETTQLTSLLSTAGVLRVTPVCSMMGSYEGEPHDGVFALTRYAKRISLRGDERFQQIGRLDELKPTPATKLTGHIMGKEDFQAMEVSDDMAALTFRSGGSSGAPKFSRFTYADYHAQMRLAGYGLLAAGLNPAADRCMNLFFGGGLYGGFVSFFTILEQLEAIQFPMAALPEHEAVGESIVTHRADTLLGMPSYLVQLFAANDALFKKHRIVKKIFYGGEHFQESQKRHLQETYGVELIASAAYGSVDAGPLGYQCTHMKGSEHHLHNDSHTFEIVALDSDTPSDNGRLLATTHLREGQHIRRYDLGDLVRRLPGVCGCGRPGLRVELLGRHGDVVRVGSSFFNYARMSRVLAEEAGYAGEMQLKILPGEKPGAPEQMIIILEESKAPRNDVIEKIFIQHEPDFKEAVLQDRVLTWRVERVTSAQLERTAGSGKLIHVIDRRRV